MSEILIVAKELPCSYSAIISCLKGFRFVLAFRGRPTFCISLGSYVPIYIYTALPRLALSPHSLIICAALEELTSTWWVLKSQTARSSYDEPCSYRAIISSLYGSRLILVRGGLSVSDQSRAWSLFWALSLRGRVSFVHCLTFFRIVVVLTGMP
jgi:hypothetical protein